MPKNDVRTASTRRKVLDASRKLFAEHGYSGVSTPQIAQQAGVSRGALYHHFSDKAAILEAVIIAEYETIASAIDAGTRAQSDPMEALIEGGDLFLSAMSDPASRRLLLIEGPAVLGKYRMDELDAATTTQTLSAGIEAAQQAGCLPTDIDPAALTSLMTGAYDRGAIDGFGDGSENQLAIRHAIRAVWFGLSRLA